MDLFREKHTPQTECGPSQKVTKATIILKAIDCCWIFLPCGMGTLLLLEVSPICPPLWTHLGTVTVTTRAWGRERRCDTQNNDPRKDVHILIPRTYECVTLHGKRDLADVIKLRILSWGDYPGLSGWPLCNHKDPYKWKKENQCPYDQILSHNKILTNFKELK